MRNTGRLLKINDDSLSSGFGIEHTFRVITGNVCTLIGFEILSVYVEDASVFPNASRSFVACTYGYDTLGRSSMQGSLNQYSGAYDRKDS